MPAWTAVGWLFYNAHLVVTRIPGVGGTRTRNFVGGDGASVLLYLLPALLLLGAGAAAAVVAAAETPLAGAAVGALVTVGYLPLAVLGTALFRYAVGDGAVAPDLVTAVLLAGIVYPAVLGAVGGAVGGSAG